NYRFNNNKRKFKVKIFYFRYINPSENAPVALIAFGEGWHNYHHVFPWDYKTAELGNYRLNITTGFIDLMAKWGLAYDLKTVDPKMIKKRILRTGDGTHGSHPIWGWGDSDMKTADYELRLEENRHYSFSNGYTADSKRDILF